MNSTKTLGAFLRLFLAACTIQLAPAGPDEELPVSESDENVSDEPSSDLLEITWTEVADAPLARFEGQSAVVGGKLYVMGGYTDGSVIPKTFEADVYDPASDTWEQLPDMPRPMTHAGTVADDTNIYFAGGVVGSDDPDDTAKIPATTEVWRFGTESEAWSVMPPLPEPRGAGALVLL